MEAIFERMESQVSGEVAQFAWIERFSRKRVPGGLNEFETDAVDLFNEWSKQKEILRKLDDASSLKKIGKLKQQAEDLGDGFSSSDFSAFEEYRDEALGKINIKISELEGEYEDLKKQYREARTYEEKNVAREIIREINPQGLGGVVRWDNAKGTKKEQAAKVEAFEFIESGV